MRLDYFVSPMCSWCWGFTPNMQKLRTSLSSKIEFRLVLTPFRVDTDSPMDMELRNYVLGQWMKVHQATGQPFDFQFNVPENFIYNTKLACLGIKAAEQQGIDKTFEYYYSIQEAFYTKNSDITQLENLIHAAEIINLNIDKFRTDIASKECMQKLQNDFNYCEQANITSYPSLMGVNQDKQILLVSGYLPYAKLEKQVMAWMIKFLKK